MSLCRSVSFPAVRFLPDPLMVCLILWALYFQYRWSENASLTNTLLAVIFTGLAIFVKPTAVFFVGIPFAALVIYGGLRKALRNPQVYWMAALSLLPGVIFIAWSAIKGGNAGAIFGSRFFPSLYIQPIWYQAWFMTAKSVVGYFPLFLSVLALFLFSEKKKRLWYASLLLAYLLLGFAFAYHIYTHDYYSMPLIPITAIGFGLIFSIIMEKIESLQPAVLAKIVILGVFAFASALSMLKARTELLSADYRYEEVYWKNLGDKIGHTSKVVALTHDYGYRLSYWGFIRPRLWDTWGDINVANLSGIQQEPFLQAFTEKTEGYNYFLVTLLNDFNSQTELHDYLYAHFPYEEGEGYILFDLQHPS